MAKKPWIPCNEELEKLYVKQYWNSRRKRPLKTEPCIREDGLVCGCRVAYKNEDGSFNACIHCARHFAGEQIQETFVARGTHFSLYLGKRKCKHCGGKQRLLQDTFFGKQTQCPDCRYKDFLAAGMTYKVPKTFNRRFKNRAWSWYHASAAAAGTPVATVHSMRDHCVNLANIALIVAEEDAAKETGEAPQKDMCHIFPASGVGDLRGMAVPCNVFVGDRKENQQAGAAVPATYYNDQVIKLEPWMPQAGSQKETTAWIKSKLGMTDQTSAQKTARKKRVKELIYREIGLELNEFDGFPTLEEYRNNVEIAWQEVQRKIKKERLAIIAAEGDASKFKQVRGDDWINSDVLAGAHAALYVVVNTLDQHAFLMSQITEEREREDMAVIIYCQTVRNNPKQAIEGYTSPFYGDNFKSFGLQVDETGQPWLCAWHHLKGRKEVERIAELRKAQEAAELAADLALAEALAMDEENLMAETAVLPTFDTWEEWFDGHFQVEKTPVEDVAICSPRPTEESEFEALQRVTIEETISAIEKAFKLNLKQWGLVLAGKEGELYQLRDVFDFGKDALLSLVDEAFDAVDLMKKADNLAAINDCQSAAFAACDQMGTKVKPVMWSYYKAARTPQGEPERYAAYGFISAKGPTLKQPSFKVG